jgi:hypothetical protein
MGLFGGTAWAGGNGAQAGTQHVHGDATGIAEVDFNPNSANGPGVPLPAGCWLKDTQAIVSTDGNAIMHFIGNKTGDWFTTTYTGGGAVYPLKLDPSGNPIQDPNTGNNEVVTSGGPLATGHLTTWFGQEDNNQNGVMHATVSFHGTENGTAVNLNGHFQFATNANGQITGMVANVTC